MHKAKMLLLLYIFSLCNNLRCVTLRNLSTIILRMKISLFRLPLIALNAHVHLTLNLLVVYYVEVMYKRSQIAR